MEVPSHHLKQEVCVSRPPYREGRHPKAVKVYTVNNESIYLVIQGVPSVGAGGELNKLCSSFGPVEDFRPLDEYPCEDKYTEVYLIKYKKIQSSRFAKRKLDEHSFFGGSLHVCYAPEYESLQETRDKLRDRRQVVAKKIRQQTNESTHRQQQRPINSTNVDFIEAGKESRVPPLPPVMSMQHKNQEVPVLNQHNEAFANTKSYIANTPVTHSLEELPSSTLTKKFIDISQPQSEDHAQHNMFQLPLPPKPFKTSPHLERENKDWRQYEYSKVPTAHATLPEGYDGRLSVPEYRTFSVSPDSVSKMETINKKDNLNPENSQIVIRAYKVQKPALKFVPRQAVKKTAVASASGHEATETKEPAAEGSQDDNLRKNAFRLGKVQGPEEMPGRKRALPTEAQQSVNNTIMSIRGKISKIIGEKVVQKP